MRETKRVRFLDGDRVVAEVDAVVVNGLCADNLDAPGVATAVEVDGVRQPFITRNDWIPE